MSEYKHNAKAGAKGKTSSGERRLMAFIRYILGGILTYGLLGLLLGWVLGMEWLWILGTVVGACGGIYLVYKHGFFRK